MQVISYAVALAGIALAVYFYMRDRANYRKIDRMLDEVLDESPLSQKDTCEGSVSALAGKMKRIQEKMEIEIAQATREREQVKGMISDMSHQLKTPLANIMMYQELLEDDTLSVSKRREFLKKMRGNSEKIDWLLNSLFKMVRLEQNVISFEAESLDIKPTIMHAVQSVLAKAGKKNIEIMTEEFDDMRLWHNRKWTAEVLENILENAVKYSEEGKSIKISVEKYEMYSAVVITDQGRGIKKSEIAKIFGRFYRSPEVENVEGSGIGLYLSRLIVEKEKGYITAEARDKEGAVFKVFLQNRKN